MQKAEVTRTKTKKNLISKI